MVPGRLVTVTPHARGPRSRTDTFQQFHNNSIVAAFPGVLDHRRSDQTGASEDQDRQCPVGLGVSSRLGFGRGSQAGSGAREQ